MWEPSKKATKKPCAFKNKIEDGAFVFYINVISKEIRQNND
tara:strand:- start:2308 stop:2430 length:123 start_codon:yes stop_codon:yes gene_type:complete